MSFRVRGGGLGAVLVIAALAGCSGKHHATGAPGDDPFHNSAGSGASADDGKDDSASGPGASGPGASRDDTTGGNGDTAAGC